MLCRRNVLLPVSGVGGAALAAVGVLVMGAAAASAGVLGGGGDPKTLTRTGMEKFRKVCYAQAMLRHA